MGHGYEEFDLAADITYGLISVACSLVGIFGNICSFFFFKAKKRDISTVIYMLITGCDIVISILVLPVGISLLSQRNPGLIFGNKINCTVWAFSWSTAITLSFFLVLCLAITRTISLFRPFKQLNSRKLGISVVLYTLATFVHTLYYLLNGSFGIAFIPEYSHCLIFIFSRDGDTVDPIALFRGVFYVAPMFVVAVSCVMTAVLLTRKNKSVQQRELQQSRNRATVTILLFALLYGTCNFPCILHLTMFIMAHLNYVDWKLINDLYKFDVSGYYFTAITTLLIAANSAVNPILYLWRMPRLREYVLTEHKKCFKVLRGFFRLNSVSMETGHV